MTDAERRLWAKLRLGQVADLRFRRQEVVGPYIADFVCWPLRLVIEVDGGQHSEPGIDGARDAYLSANGFRVVRFWNNEVLTNMDGVLQVIVEAARERAQQAPTQPSPGGGGPMSDDSDESSPHGGGQGGG